MLVCVVIPPVLLCCWGALRVACTLVAAAVCGDWWTMQLFFSPLTESWTRGPPTRHIALVTHVVRVPDRGPVCSECPRDNILNMWG